MFPSTVLALWQLSAEAGLVNPYFLPPPTVIAERAYDYLWVTRAAWRDIAGSMYRVAVGFGLGAVAAVACGLAVGLWHRVDLAVGGTISVLKNIAPIAWIPLAILWFGLGNMPAFFLIFIGAFFPVLLNTIGGVRGIEQIHLRVGQNVGAKGFALFRGVILPGALPSIFTGLRVALGISWMVVIVAEMLAVGNGLGYRLTQAREYGWIDLVLVCMLLVGLCGYLFDKLATRLSAHVLRWHVGLEQR